MNVENGILNIDAPNSDVSLTLKSLHDSGFIRCKTLTVYISDDFFNANLIQAKDGELSGIVDTIEEIQEMGPKPSLYIESQNTKVEVMSSFDILRMQIMSKMKK